MTADSVKEALKHLNGNCDGAKSNDGEGFGRYDTAFGKEMAKKITRGEDLTPMEYFKACKMLQKYSNQLLEIGITKEDLEIDTSPSEKPCEPIDWRKGYFIGFDGQTYEGSVSIDKETGETKSKMELKCEGYAYLYKIIETVGEDSNIFEDFEKPINH
jgi:hypothetical protein